MTKEEINKKLNDILSIRYGYLNVPAFNDINDLIDQQNKALLKEVDKWKQDHKDLLDIYIKADEEITNLKKQLQEKEREVEGLRDEEWISVKDRLPNDYGQYLIYCPTSFAKNCRFLSANYYDDNKRFYGDWSENIHEDVTHWRKIKKPTTKP